jgi:hypothetical protein
MHASLRTYRPALGRRPVIFFATAIFLAGIGAWHNEIFAGAAWTWEQITESYLIRHIDTVTMGAGFCFG